MQDKDKKDNIENNISTNKDNEQNKENNIPDNKPDENQSLDKDKIDALSITGKDNQKYYIKIDEENSQIKIYNNQLEEIKTNMNIYNCNDLIEYSGFIYTYNFGVVELEDNSIWYNNTIGIDTSKIISDIDFMKKPPISVKVENNKIYFLMPKLNLTNLGDGIVELNDKDYGIIEERVYTINNNQLEYNVINNYKIIGIYQTC